MKIEELKNKIEEQKEKNINLFKIFQYRLHEIEMQPTIEKWRRGSEKLKSMVKELQELERKENNINYSREDNKTFVNGFGEATIRNITCAGYERAEKRNQQKILSFMRSK